MRIVTSGSRYIDIDAYAGVIAYAELLNARGIPARAVSSSTWNESISKTVRSWNAPIAVRYKAEPNDTFALIDVSDPDHFDTIVDPSRVAEVIDHHPGFEGYWHERIGSGSHIEFIGAACTLVYERWKEAKLQANMSQTSAKALLTGILDNTLNFKAHVTTARDKAAYEALSKHSQMPKTWPAHYFAECQEAILAQAEKSITNDSKILNFRSFPAPLGVGQLVVWDASDVLRKHLLTIETVLAGVKADWFMNLVSVGEGFSYFVATNPVIQDWLSKLLGIHFSGNIAQANRLWLRKEVIRQDMMAASS